MSTIMSASPSASVSHSHDINDRFGQFVIALQQHLNTVLAAPQRTRLFRVKPQRGELFEIYLDSFADPAKRQEHNCSCCRDFLNRFGGLVVIDPEEGYQHRALLWDTDAVPEAYREAVGRMRRLVAELPIESVFHWDDAHLGVETKGGFDHFYVELPFTDHGRQAHKTPGTNMAEGRENFRIVSRFQGDKQLSLDYMRQALHAFDHDERLKCYPVHRANLNWAIEFLDAARQPLGRTQRQNRAWMAVATEPMGRLRILQGVMGEYLSKFIADGAPEAKRVFLTMVDPKDYMRPKAAPSQANVQQGQTLHVGYLVARINKKGFTTYFTGQNEKGTSQRDRWQESETDAFKFSDDVSALQQAKVLLKHTTKQDTLYVLKLEMEVISTIN